MAALIPDGATIQTGIGGIPEATLALLGDHKDLGIHSEMVPDGVIELIQAGVVNGERKTLHPHKVIAGFVLGSKPLFDFIDNNPIFEFHPTAYCNDPFDDRPERPHGGHQLGHRSGSHRAGLLRLHGPRSLQRHRRAGGFSARRGPLQGRAADHRAAFHRQERHGLAHRYRSCSPAPAW